MTRRIKKPLSEFFDSVLLTPMEHSFIQGCLRAQQKYPQLTGRQWEIVKEIEQKYRDLNGKT